MHPIHRILYDSIVESAILPYYRQTDYYQRREAQAQWEEHLQKRLSPSLLADLESFQLAVSRTQDAELEAMFLAVTRKELRAIVRLGALLGALLGLLQAFLTQVL